MGIGYNLNLNLNFPNCGLSCCNKKQVIESIIGECTNNMDVKNQLEMLHNPFADSTTQPKIPDGQETTSLGHTASYIGEYEVHSDVGHMLLFPGLAGSLLYTDGGDGTPTSEWTEEDEARGYRAPGFNDTGGPSFVNYTDSGTSFTIEPSLQSPMSRWRQVSCGMQMKLLNATESDDGWWEAIRISARRGGNDWYFTTIDGIPTSDKDPTSPIVNINNLANSAHVVPYGYLTNATYKTATLSDNPTYSTGLLRDLHKVQFELLQTSDQVRFLRLEDEFNLPAADWTGDFNASPWHLAGDQDSSTPATAAENYCQYRYYDVIYIRLHTRGSAPNSKFHINVQSNMEFVHEFDEKEKRYETKTESIGTGAVSLHLQARRSNGNAATLIG